MKSTTNVALSFKNLKFSYGITDVLSLKDFSVNSGEIVFLYGPSGSGKSTLLEIIAGILPVQHGQLSVLDAAFDKMSVHQLDDFRAKNIGYIFQSFNLIPYLSVTENLILPLMFTKEKLDQSRFDHLVNGLGLKPYLNRPVANLSVGQQQRVAAARALLKKPKIILADEPTSALDYDHREQFLNLLFKFCKEDQTTVIFVSHDRTIEKLFDRSISLKELNLVQIDPEAIV